jgi:hypothetical protein
VSGERRRAISTPGERVDPARRGPASILVSVAIHLVAIAILLRIAIVPLSWLEAPRPAKPEATHVDYVRTAADSAKDQRAGGDNRRATNTPEAAPLVAPSAVPSALPPEPPKTAAPAAQAEGGTGPVIGGGGPTRGVTPAFTDPRLWAPTDPLPIRPKTPTERLDSAIASRVHHLEDSLRALGPQRADGDWSWTGKDGKKYGIDQKYIHLGPFSIPTALLALLPLNVQGNPTTYGEARRIGAIRAEILEQSARSARDNDFNQAVRELRDRKQKERADKAKADQTLPEAPPVRIIP